MPRTPSPSEEAAAAGFWTRPRRLPTRAEARRSRSPTAGSTVATPGAVSRPPPGSASGLPGVLDSGISASAMSPRPGPRALPISRAAARRRGKDSWRAAGQRALPGRADARLGGPPPLATRRPAPARALLRRPPLERRSVGPPEELQWLRRDALQPEPPAGRSGRRSAQRNLPAPRGDALLSTRRRGEPGMHRGPFRAAPETSCGGRRRERRGSARERRAPSAPWEPRFAREHARGLLNARATTSARAERELPRAHERGGGADEAAGRSASRDATSTTGAVTPRGAVASLGSFGDVDESAVGAAPRADPGTEPGTERETEPATAGMATSGLPDGKTADASGSNPRSRERSERASAAEPGTAAGWLSGAARAGASVRPGEADAADLTRSSRRGAIAIELSAAPFSELVRIASSPRAERPGAGASSALRAEGGAILSSVPAADCVRSGEDQRTGGA
jgi:hypothetical protein